MPGFLPLKSESVEKPSSQWEDVEQDDEHVGVGVVKDFFSERIEEFENLSGVELSPTLVDLVDKGNGRGVKVDMDVASRDLFVPLLLSLRITLGGGGG